MKAKKFPFCQNLVTGAAGHQKIIKIA